MNAPSVNLSRESSVAALTGLFFLALLAAPKAFAANDYWYPLNAGGTWDTTTANWSTVGNNARTAATWVSGSTAIFSTATDGEVDAYPITIGVPGLTAANLNFITSGFQLTSTAPQTLTLSLNNSTGGTPTAGNTALWVGAGKTAYIGTNITLALTATSYGTRIGLDNGAVLIIESGGKIDKTAGANRDLVFGTASGTTSLKVYGTITRSVANDTASISFGNNTGSMNVEIMNGGTISTAGNGNANSLASIVVGHTSGATAVLTMDPGCIVTASDSNISDTYAGIKLGVSGATATLNLNGGTLTVQKIFTAGSASTLHFNGGTLKANTAQANFISGLTTADVRNGGGTIDNSGFNITIAQPLLHSTVSGDNATDGGLVFADSAGSATTTLTGTNTYTGNTIISGGILRLSGQGSIANTRDINIANGAAFDVSSLNSAFQLGSAEVVQTLSGSGTIKGNVNSYGPIASLIQPGGAEAVGTLTFVNGASTSTLDLRPGAAITFDLSTNSI